MLRLVIGTFNRHTEIIGLFLRELGELDADFFEVQAGDLLVQFLGQTIDANLFGGSKACVNAFFMNVFIVEFRPAWV